MLSDIGGEVSASVLDVQSLIFLIKEDWICVMARRHANNILLARYLPLTLWRRQWTHPLMILCILLGLNRTIEHMVSLNVLWLFCLFLFDFVHSHARCGCCYVVCSRFEVMQIKRVDCKRNNKFLREIFVTFLETCTHKNIRPRKCR